MADRPVSDEYIIGHLAHSFGSSEEQIRQYCQSDIKYFRTHILPREGGVSRESPMAMRLLLLDDTNTEVYRYNDVTGEVLPFNTGIWEMTCVNGHTFPSWRDCYCGLQFSIDLDWIESHKTCEIVNGKLPILGLFELLGKVNTDGKHVQSQRAFLRYILCLSDRNPFVSYMLSRWNSKYPKAPSFLSPCHFSYGLEHMLQSWQHIGIDLKNNQS